MLNNDHSSNYCRLPLSSTQQVVWLDQTLNPDSSNYNIGIQLRIDGHLDEALFTQAFDMLVSRHDALRLQLVHTDSLPFQELTDAISEPINTVDFSQYDDAESQAQQHIDTLFMRPFDLHERLWRSELMRVSGARWYWQFCCHHLISDGWSLKILFNDLIDTYNRLISREEIKGVAPSYLKFVTEDLAYLSTDNYQSDLKFWLDSYNTLPPALIRRSTPDKKHVCGAAFRHFWQLEHECFQKIEHIASEQGLSVLHFMFAVLAFYFSRTSNTDDIVIGIPIHNRRNARQKSTVGMFSSIIPVRVTVCPQDSFLTVMRKAATELRRCYKHQRFPLTEINHHTRLRQQTGRSHLCDVSLSFEWFKPKVKMSDVNTSLQAYRATQLPLAIFINQYDFEDKNHPVTVEFNFDVNYLSREEVAAIQSRLAVLMDDAIASLDITVEKASILPDAERRQLLVEFNATAADFPQQALIHQLFEAQAARTPDAVAVLFEARSLTYDELNRRANQLAHHLISLGVRPDDRVALCVERSLEMVVALLGILKAGAAYVPLDPGYPAERLAYMLDDAQPVALLTQSGLTAVHTDAVPVVLLDTGAFDAGRDSNPDPQALGLSADNLAYVIYTSGSTGQPKGVMNAHRGLCNRLVWMQRAYRLTPDDRVLQKTPFSFDVSVWEFFWPLLFGARLVMARPDGHKDTGYLARLIEDAGITTLHFVPSMLQQ
ncbi:non-ribosomal peptide synthetase, partial [Lonsdalea populi]